MLFEGAVKSLQPEIHGAISSSCSRFGHSGALFYHSKKYPKHKRVSQVFRFATFAFGEKYVFSHNIFSSFTQNVKTLQR